MMMTDMQEDGPLAGASGDAAAAILAVLGERPAGSSICPTEAARRVAACFSGTGSNDWRRHLGAVRQAARYLAQDGAIDILRKGKVVEPGAVRGVIRLRLSHPMSKISEAS